MKDTQILMMEIPGPQFLAIVEFLSDKVIVLNSTYSSYFGGWLVKAVGEDLDQHQGKLAELGALKLLRVQK